VAKLQLLGCYMTRDILANIETQRCIVKDKQIEYFAAIFGVQRRQLVPGKTTLQWQDGGFGYETIVTRRPMSKSSSAQQSAT
jgi:hypothetical protein